MPSNSGQILIQRNCKGNERYGLDDKHDCVVLFFNNYGGCGEGGGGDGWSQIKIWLSLGGFNTG